MAKYQRENKARISKTKKIYYAKHRKQAIERSTSWNKKNNERRREIAGKWDRENRKQRNEYERCRLQNDPQYKLVKSLRHRLYLALKGKCRAAPALKLVGCSLEELMDHLESMFSENMSWDNHGEWHIDHIKPLSGFDLSDAIQQREAMNWKNLQPLWASDNARKGAR